MEQVKACNQSNDAQIKAVVQDLGITATDEQWHDIAHENARLRVADLFTAQVFTKVLARYPNLTIDMVNGAVTAQAQQAIESINQLMLTTPLERNQMVSLLNAAGLGAFWLDQKINTQDVKSIMNRTLEVETWWDALEAEHSRMHKATRFVHPILRQSFLSNSSFDFKEDADLSSINTLSTKIGRGTFNEQLNRLSKGWALTELEYKQLYDFNQTIAELVKYNVLNQHKSKIVDYQQQLAINMANIYPLTETIGIAQQAVTEEMTKYYADITIGDLLVNVDKIHQQQALLNEQKSAISQLYGLAYDQLSQTEQSALNNITAIAIPLSHIDHYRDNTILQVALLNRHINQQLEKVDSYYHASLKLLHYFTLRQFSHFSEYLQTLQLEQNQLLSTTTQVAADSDTLLIELNRFLKRLEHKLWQLPIDEAAILQQQFAFLSENDAQRVAQVRQRLLQMRAEVVQAIDTVYRQQQEQQNQKLGIAYANSAIRIQSPRAIPESQDIPQTMVQVIQPIKPVSGSSYGSRIETTLSNLERQGEVWIKEERINADLTRYTHRNGLSIVDSKLGTSFYERPANQRSVDQALHEKEKEMCRAWADMLMPQIVKPPITIGGYDKALRKIMAEEFNRRGIEVTFENDIETIPKDKPEEILKARGGFFNPIGK